MSLDNDKMDDALQKAKLLYQKNLAWLEEYQPALYERIIEHEYDSSQLMFNDEGKIINVLENNKNYYSKDADIFAREQSEDTDCFSRIKFSIAPNMSTFPLTYSSRGYAQRSKERQIQAVNLHYFCADLFSKIMDKGLVTFDTMIADEQMVSETKNGAFVICAGIGLGYHIEAFFKKYDFSNLIVIETQIGFIQHCAHTHDFSVWHEKCLKKSGTFTIIYTDKSESVKPYLSDTIYNNINYPLFPYSFIFKHIDSAFYREIIDSKDEWSKSFMVNKGFAEDEYVMQINNFFNCFRSFIEGREQPDKILTKIPVEFRKLPVLVIGNAPSLDKSIDVIKEKAKQGYVIIACGTALGTLLYHDIFPHIFVNAENSFTNYWAIYNSAKEKKDDSRFKKIIFIGLPTTNPGLVSLFQRAIFVMRYYSAGAVDVTTHCLEENINYEFLYLSPTVINTAMAVTIALGFKEIYMLGVDLGKRDAKYSHSEKSLYVRNQEEINEITLENGFKERDILKTSLAKSYATTRKNSKNKKKRGNFGNDVDAIGTFLYTESTLINLMAHLKRAHINSYQVFNCSDGVFIKNMIPLLPHLIPDLPEELHNCAEKEIDEIFDVHKPLNLSEQMIDNYTQMLIKRMEIIDSEQDKFNKLMEKYHHSKVTNYAEFQKFSEEIRVCCLKSTDENREITKILIGSVTQYLLYMYIFFIHIDSDGIDEYMKIACEDFQEAINQFYEYIKIFYQYQLDFLEKKQLGQIDKNFVMPTRRKFTTHHYHELLKVRKKIENSYNFVFPEEQIVEFNDH